MTQRPFLVVTMSNVLVIHPSLPARSVKQLLSLSKAQQGTLHLLRRVSAAPIISRSCYSTR